MALWVEDLLCKHMNLESTWIGIPSTHGKARPGGACLQLAALESKIEKSESWEFAGQPV